MLKHSLSGFLISLLLLSCISIAAQNNIPDTSADVLVTRALACLKEEKLDSTTIYLEKARQIYLEYKDFGNYISNFIEAAKTLYSSNYHEKGINILHQADKDVASTMDAYERQVEVVYQIARGYYFIKNYDTCIDLIYSNLSKIDSNSLAFADHNNLLGVSYRGKGMIIEALSAYQKTATVRKQILGVRHTQVASVLNNMGVAYEYLKLYNKALECYNQAFNIRAEILKKDDPTLANVLLNMGGLFDIKGEYNSAVQYYERALAIFQANPDDFEVRIADIFNNLAVTYKNKGAYQESTSYYQQAIQKYQSLPDDYSVEIGNIYLNWSNLAELQKNHIKEIELNQKAIELYAQTLEPNHPSLIMAHNNLGIAYANSGDYEGALAELKGLVPLIENNEEQRERFANVNNDIADVYYKLNKYGEAKLYNLKALNIQQALFNNKSYKLAYTYNNLAQIAEKEGNRNEALQYLQQALAANHNDFEVEYENAAPSPLGFYKYDYFVESLMHKAQLMRIDGDQTALLQAKLLYEVADSALTLVRNELLSSEDKIRLSEKFYKLSQAAIENCIHLAEVSGSQQYLEEAFAFSEKSKSNVLAQSLAANQAKQFAGIPDSLIALEDQLKSDINFFNLKLAEQPDSTEKILYQNELFTAQQTYRTLITQLEKDYPFYYQLKYDQTVPRVRAIQFALPGNTALVSYFTGDSVLYSFVITKKDFTIHSSAIDKNFYEDQVGFRKSITSKLNEDYIILANNLYQKLFPFNIGKNIQSLIIIPDGTLSKLPFEALLSKKVNPRNEINFSQLPYLVNNYEMSYALSARLYYQEQSVTTTQLQSEGLLAYAPVFGELQSTESFINDIRNPLDNQEINRNITFDGKFITPLPATANEIQAIAEVFKQKGQKATTLLYQNANEKRLKQLDINQSRYLHIATHGFINEEQPDLSGLLLFPDTTAGEDHILYSGEVYNLDLNARLVVLSACETGLGKVTSGEGLLGLSRAFFYAGAENLVVSLWKVQDQATSDLMVAFYQAHLNNKSNNFGNPLQQAKLNMIRTDRFSHPYYWSAFVLIGQ